MSTTLRSLHDQLLALKPDDATHVPSDCEICSGAAEVASSTTAGGTVSDTKTYEAEYNDALAKVSALEAKVAELSAANEESEIESKVAEARAEVEAQVAELQTKLDAKTIEAETAKTEHEALVALLDEAEKASVEAAAFEARKTERSALVKEAAPLLPDEYLTENADRFANMDEEAFTASLDAMKAISTKVPAVSGKEIPAHTAMTAARSDSDNSESNPLRDVFALRGMGVDTRTIN